MTTILSLSLRAHHSTLDSPGNPEHDSWYDFLRAIWDQPGISDVYFGKDVNSPTEVELFLSTCYVCSIVLAKYVMVLLTMIRMERRVLCSKFRLDHLL